MGGEEKEKKTDLATALHVKVEIKPGDGERVEDQSECWICRESGSAAQPLMSFCACKGTMNGVHALCVENWIHLQRARGDTDNPRCSVCHYIYEGHDAYPSILFLGGTLCGRVWNFILRAFLVALVLMVYWRGTTAEQPIGFLLLFTALLYFVARAFTLINSLPIPRPPPENRWQRYFYSTDKDELGQIFSELWSAVIVSCAGVLQGQLEWYWVLPLAVLAVLPAFRIMVPHPSMRCMQIIALMLALTLSPIFLVVALVRKILTSPRKVFHVGGPIFHLYIALASIGLAVGSTALPLIILWSVHVGIIAIGGTITLVEYCSADDAVWLEWKQSPTWLFTWELTLICVYYVNIYCTPPENVARCYAVVSVLWFLCVSTLAFTVNRTLLLEYYDRWRRRHAVFNLDGGLLESVV